MSIGREERVGSVCFFSYASIMGYSDDSVHVYFFSYVHCPWLFLRIVYYVCKRIFFLPFHHFVLYCMIMGMSLILDDAEEVPCCGGLGCNSCLLSSYILDFPRCVVVLVVPAYEIVLKLPLF